MNVNQVGGIPTPLKNMDFVSWDYEIPNWMESHKFHVPNRQPVDISTVHWVYKPTMNQPGRLTGTPTVDQKYLEHLECPRASHFGNPPRWVSWKQAAQRYPLVNIQKTMERSTMLCSWVDQLFRLGHGLSSSQILPFGGSSFHRRRYPTGEIRMHQAVAEIRGND